MARRMMTLALGASLGALVAATPALAQDAPSNADLAALVRQQAAEIKVLQDRLGALEAHERVQAAATASAASVSTPQQQEAAAAQARTQAQVAAATQSTQDDEVAQLQTQVAQLAQQSKRSVKVDWDDGGPTFSSGDGFFTFHPRGRVVLDISHTSGSSYDARNVSGTEFRDLRLGAEGTIGKLGYKVETAFSDNTLSLKDAYISYGSKVFGHDYKIFLGDKLNDRSIDGSSSLVSIPFLERNAVAVVVSPQTGFYGLGVQAQLHGKRWHIGVQVKGDGPGDNDGTHDDSIAYLARATFTPIKGRNGFVHLGAWGFHEELDRTTDTINKTEPIASDFNDEVRVSASSIANTKSDDGYGFEAGGVFRSLWGFGEYGDRIIHVADGGDSVQQKAYSVYGGWFITGDKPGFSSRSGLWVRPTIAHPFTEGGTGGFEILARYDKYDFKDAPRGGDGNAITVGGAWYLNDWADFKFNYIRWTTNNLVGDFKGHDNGDTVVLRGEVVF